MINNQLSGVRRSIKMFNIFGLVFSIITTLLILGLINQLTTLGEVGSASYFAILIVCLIVPAAANIYFTLVIINFMNKASDDELIANRYILSVFSVGLQGLITPFMLCSLPNSTSTDNSARMNPKFVIAKHYGMAGLVISVSSALILALYAWQLGIMGDETVLLMFYILGGIGVLSLITLPLFWLKSSEETFKNKSGIYFLQITLSIISLLIATTTVLWIMLLAVIRLLQNIAYAMDNRDNIFLFLISLLMVFMQFWYVSFVWSICFSTLKGIWSSNSNALDYKVYSKLEEKKETEKQQKSNR